MVLSSELAYILAFFLPGSQLGSNHFRKQFLSFDQRYLYVAVRIAVECQLTGYAFGQAGINSRVGRRQLADDIVALVRLLDVRELFGVGSQEVIQFGDESLHGRDELNQTFRDEDSTEVVALSSTVGHYLSNVSHDVVQ